tara:strand:+ start:3485 stop:4069 length:585 start_codon:yes stop_codon:yes gene_type:complete
MGRLQRDATMTGFNGTAVTRFTQVLYRHGLMMGAAALVFGLLSLESGPLWPSLTGFLENPGKYIGALLGILVFIGVYVHFSKAGRQPQHVWWLVYLLYISVVEELAFRLFLPDLASIWMTPFAAIILSNLIFAGLHYVTLRWKLANCIFTFFGGIGLSRLFEFSGDLALVVLAHFLVTFLNTPRPPDRPVQDRT